MSMAYAHETAQSDDRYVHIAERAFEMLSGAMFPGAAVVNALPICAWSSLFLILAFLRIRNHSEASAEMVPGRRV